MNKKRMKEVIERKTNIKVEKNYYLFFSFQIEKSK